MNRLVVCMDCPNYQKGGYCTHKHKDVSALAPACDYAKTLNQKFNPEDTDEPMTTSSAKDYDIELAEPKTKRCPRCGRDLPKEAFGKNRATKDGFQNWCKECTNAQNKEHRAAKASARNQAPAPDPEPKTKAPAVVVREKMTAKQMVDALRAEGWTVTCYRTITEEL